MQVVVYNGCKTVVGGRQLSLMESHMNGEMTVLSGDS